MADNGKRPGLADDFNHAHSTRLQSPMLERLWQTAYGDDYPAVVKPNAFYSLTTLCRLKNALGVMADRTLVDLGCGHGGAGLWAAQQLGAKLIGIDLSPGGVALAASRARELEFQDRSRFQVSDMTATGLPDASCDAAMSLDVLLFVPDQAAAIRETARILRPGCCFGFTTWEQQTGYSQRLKALQLEDYRPVLESASFDVEIYDEPPNWQRQQRSLLEASIAHERELVEEMGSMAASKFLEMARGALEDMPSRRYVFGVGRRR